METVITADVEEAIMLALEQRDRVRRIRFGMPVLKLQKLIMAIDGEYPILEYLILWVPPKEKSTVSILPETLQIPHLRHLTINCSIPIRFQLLTTAVGLVTLHLALHPHNSVTHLRYRREVQRTDLADAFVKAHVGQPIQS